MLGIPALHVVGHRHGGARVLGSQQARTVVQPQPFHQELRPPAQLLEALLGGLGRGELEHLDLVELVSPHGTALLGPVPPGLPAVARRVRERLDRQPLEIEDLVAIDVKDRRLGGGQQEPLSFVPGGAKVEDVVGELWKLSGRIAALGHQEVGRKEEVVAAA